MFRMEPKAIRSMSFATVSQSTRRMLAAEPVRFCPTCTGSDCGTIQAGTRRSQLQGWRLTCPLCAGCLLDKSETQAPSPLCRCWNQALNGQRLFEAEIAKGVQSWANPSEIARLLLMRRIPTNISQDTCLERFRVLGAVCPEFVVVVADRQIPLPQRESQSCRSAYALHCLPPWLLWNARGQKCWSASEPYHGHKSDPI